MGACSVFAGREKSKSSSKVTHWVGFPPGGGAWRRGARAEGTEEGGARGKTGAGVRGSRGGGAGLRVDDGSNRDMVRWS